MMNIDYSDKNILVVGGSSGIGNAIAQAYRATGGNVHVWGTRPTIDDYTAEEGSDMSGLGYSCVDVSDSNAIAHANTSFDDIDILILCQGIVLYKRGEYERSGWDKVMSINLDSLMDCAMHFKEGLSKRKGNIIIVSSVGGYIAQMGTPAYAASKAGAISLTKSLAQGWAREGVRVNGIAPGMVATKMTKVTTENPKRLEATLRSIPAGRLGKTSDMADAALFLTSPYASYICGQTLTVDGGLTL